MVKRRKHGSAWLEQRLVVRRHRRGIWLISAGLLRRPRFIAGKTIAWPQKIADKVLASFGNKLFIFELCRLNYIAGALYAEAARSLMRETGTSPEDLAVIAFDGQTIYQEPADHARMKLFADDEDLVGRWLDGPYPCGLQIAEPAIVAAACDTTVVTQFRPVEHALGGSGAPHSRCERRISLRHPRQACVRPTLGAGHRPVGARKPSAKPKRFKMRRRDP